MGVTKEHPVIEKIMLTGYPHSDYLNFERPARTCGACTSKMNEGFLNEITGDNYCSTKCLDKSIPKGEQEKLFDDGFLFWTDWYY